MLDRIYIGRYSKQKGISICSYNDGSINEIDTLPLIEDPSYLYRNGNILYAVIETADYNGKNGGAVASFRLDDKPVLINIVNTMGQHPCYLITDSKRTMLFAANYTEGTISVFPLNNDGSIDEMCFEVKHEGSGPNPNRQEKPHMHYIQFMEDETYICVSDLGTDRLSGYKIIKENQNIDNNADDNAHDNSNVKIQLIHAFDIKLPEGSGPRHFVYSPDGMYIYVITELSNTICVYKKEDGFKYTHIQTISTLPEGNADCKSSTAAIRITKDGRFIYASNRGHDSVSVYKAASESGLLEMVQNISSNGECPRDIILDENEEYLLCANQSSSTVTSLKRDRENGCLSLTDKVFNTERPVCLIF